MLNPAFFCGIIQWREIALVLQSNGCKTQDHVKCSQRSPSMAEFFFNLLPDWKTVLSFFSIVVGIVVGALFFIDMMLYLLIQLGVIIHILLEVGRGIKSVINALRGRLPPREEEKKDNNREEKKKDN